MPAHHALTKPLALPAATGALAASSAAQASPAATTRPAVNVLAEPQAGVVPFIQTINSARDQLPVQCGAHLHLGHDQGYDIHATLLLTDGWRALVGAQSLSRGSLRYDRERWITITSPRRDRRGEQGVYRAMPEARARASTVTGRGIRRPNATAGA